ncbi:hypothetical protein GW17_00034310 [Ensete ventricosum]|nr:hypothetical protein GW17_00034310 [Ensete ventricosum]
MVITNIKREKASLSPSEENNKRGRNFEEKRKANTDLYGGDAEAACLEDNPYTAGRHPFPQSTHHSPRHQHVLHLPLHQRIRRDQRRRRSAITTKRTRALANRKQRGSRHTPKSCVPTRSLGPFSFSASPPQQVESEQWRWRQWAAEAGY